ncbi:TonB-dependent receptor [Chitinophaga sancti]|uniref:CarboxypepD_reg-like domain-containing protein n=1 Tax=Chitinophaga sancti TaxID=1004 RepID=A0A1K1T031_9BACT|nr:TonB-dependent receptor [Chitinophaga sancti]WQD59557.1 TonB-dependent receptor [Chitinophaga sancti]WQG88309.1 TonB-dependent receptor [Chitinophaga sancti]SFW89930.1 CarboxypepD_reg-like domain-containing protein [Chitinophaga sancti]
MMKIPQRIFQLILCLLLSPLLSLAQKQTLKGIIADSTTGKPVQNAAVYILKDNKAIATSFSDKEGGFRFVDIPMDNYQLYISLTGYKAYHVALRLSKDIANLGKILIKNNVITLNTIEVKQSIPPITIKKDTLEFNANSIKTRPNAVVEELLKRVPGVFIDPSGKITAQGEIVNRILVDGKPFFGNNTSLTTQNLPAEIIDKIQLIDAKSDQAQFTGFDDGIHEKIINITLKKNRRRGTIATTSAGYGTSDRYAINSNVNNFNEQNRLSTVANGNNLNDQDFNPGNTHAGMQPGNGLANSWSGAVNYNMDDKKRIKLDASYEALDNHSQNNTYNFRQTFLPDTSWYYNQQNNSTNHSVNHAIRTRLDYRIDNSQSLLIAPEFTFNKADNLQNNKYESLNKNKDTSISGQALNTSRQSTSGVSVHGLFRKQFKKKGQTFSADFSATHSQTSGNNTFQTRDYLLLLDSIASYNRLLRNNTTNNNINLRLSYTQPLSEHRFLQLFYSWNNGHNNITNKTFDIDSISGKYNHSNDSLSNSSKIYSGIQSAGVNIATNKNVYDYTLGINIQMNSSKNENSNAPSFHKNFINLFPAAKLNIFLSKEKKIHFAYNGSTISPTVQQLQPLPNLANSLLIQKGNPDLKPGFRHSFNVDYNAINSVTFRGLFMNLSTEFIRNKIVNVNRYDSTGHQYTIPINANGAMSLSGIVTNTLPIKSMHSILDLSSGISYNKDITFTVIGNDNIKSYTHIISLNQSANFYYSYQSLMEFTSVLQVTYSGNHYGALSTSNSNYLTYNLFFTSIIYLPAGFMLGNEFRYIMNRGRAAGYNTNIPLLNGYIAKSLFKQKQGLIKIYGYDLLHQNVSVTRNTGDNFIEDVRQTVLKPYLMLSFTWYFKKYPARKEKEG